jgi:hypothetical protein
MTGGRRRPAAGGELILGDRQASGMLGKYSTCTGARRILFRLGTTRVLPVVLIVIQYYRHCL